MKRFLLECGHYTLGDGQLIGDRRTCEVCPHITLGMNRMIVDVASVSPALLSGEFVRNRQASVERARKRSWSVSS